MSKYLIKAQVQDALLNVGKFTAPDPLSAMQLAVQKYKKLLQNCQMQATLLDEDTATPALLPQSQSKRL